MITLVFLFVAESFVIATVWHSKSAQAYAEPESDRPDPAVLFCPIRHRRKI